MKRTVKELKEIAREIRILIIKMLTKAGSGHPGGSLSVADLVTALYFKVMKHDPMNPKWPDRDRFILSKGHCVPAQYAALALSGYFDQELLMTLRKFNSSLQGHPDMTKTVGLEISSGSLGQGLSVGGGIALAGKYDRKDYRVYVILGDGEVQEGQVWEAAMSAAHYKLDNLCAFLDYNKLQIDGKVEEVMNINPISDKWRAFGWHSIEIDGNKMEEVLKACQEAKEIKNKPTMIIAHTVKGKGVSFMEGMVNYHGVAPTSEECERALKEL
ncbi:transketolase [bacterium]|nr:transketolase [bacterium]MBU1152734.1 transketolase [bacterium]MBU1782499.1 transketolase [bacterium]